MGRPIWIKRRIIFKEIPLFYLTLVLSHKIPLLCSKYHINSSDLKILEVKEIDHIADEHHDHYLLPVIVEFVLLIHNHPHSDY